MSNIPNPNGFGWIKCPHESFTYKHSPNDKVFPYYWECDDCHDRFQDDQFYTQTELNRRRGLDAKVKPS